MKNQILAAMMVITILLQGCSTIPPDIDEAETVPTDRVRGKLPITSLKPARLIIIRDKSLFAGSIVSFYLTVNNVQLAELRTNEKYTTLVDPGEVFISVHSDAIGATNKPVQVETVLHPLKNYVYRVGNDGNWLLSLNRDLELSDK